MRKPVFIHLRSKYGFSLFDVYATNISPVLTKLPFFSAKNTEYPADIIADECDIFGFLVSKYFAPANFNAFLVTFSAESV